MKNNQVTLFRDHVCKNVYWSHYQLDENSFCVRRMTIRPDQSPTPIPNLKYQLELVFNGAQHIDHIITESSMLLTQKQVTETFSNCQVVHTFIPPGN